MAKWNMKGLDDYVLKIEGLTKQSETVIGRAIYDGAEIVADACKEGVRNIPVDDTPYREDMRSGIRTNERTDLVDSMGIAKMRNDNGFINVKVGFDGYNRYGTPNAVIARTVESGTSFLPKFGTLARATRGIKKKCEDAMEARFNKEIEKLMK